MMLLAGYHHGCIQILFLMLLFLMDNQKILKIN